MKVEHEARKWLVIGIIASVSLLVPALTQWAFRSKARCPFLEAEWSAGEFLDYAGGIVGAAATIVAVRMTIQLEREERLDDQRLNVLPLIAITSLEKRLPDRDLLFADVSRPEEGEAVLEEYSEYSPGREFIVVDGDGRLAYVDKLSEEQNRLAHGGAYVEEVLGKGLTGAVQNKSFYLPLSLSSSGNGPAINVSVHMEKDGRGPRLKGTGAFLHLPTVQLLVGESRYVGVFFEDRLSEAAQGSYELVMDYYDTLGHRYEQRHELALVPSQDGEVGSISLVVDLKIKQIRLA